MIVESLIDNDTLESVNMKRNHILQIRELKVINNSKVDQALNSITKIFTNLKKIRNIQTLLITDWLFEHMEYPDSVSRLVKEAKDALSGKILYEEKDK